VIAETPVAIVSLRQNERQATLLMSALTQRNGIANTVSEAKIRQVGMIEIDQDGSMIAEFHVTHLLAVDTCRYDPRMKANFSECPVQEDMRFIAPTTTSARDGLVKDPTNVPVVWAVQLNIKGIVRYCECLAAMNLRKAGPCRFRGT
jgi:hypothetical protein